ncbi:MAG: type III pantothenate kinase [Bacteroidota bacterium]
MNLIIDIGNTIVKYAIFDNVQLIELVKKEYDLTKSFILTIRKLSHVTHIIESSVIGDNISFSKGFLQKEKNYLAFNHTTPIPIKNKYKTPKTLGNDRLANAVGAAALFPAKDILIIDMGTCIKYDFIDKEKNYQGGAISPGLQMRYKALNKFTEKLPLIKSSKEFSLTGNSTQQSILSGVQNGIIFEIDGMIEQYEKKHNELKVIITGGDHAFFADHLKSSIFAAPNLTLIGLNEILNYNVRKNS